MSLTLLTYLVITSIKLSEYFKFVAIIFGTAAIPLIFGYFMSKMEESSLLQYNKISSLEEQKNLTKLAEKFAKISVIGSMSLFFITSLIPEEKDSYILLGVYAGETLAKSKTTNVILDKTVKVIEHKLDKMLTEPEKQSIKKVEPVKKENNMSILTEEQAQKIMGVASDIAIEKLSKK